MSSQTNVYRIMTLISLTSLILLYSVMILGVYLSSSHQGLSCPDWPLCPNGFNFPPPQYFFEHIHRLMALITTISISVTAIYALKKVKSVRIPATLACVFIFIQIVMGFLVTYTRLEPLITASHLSMGILLFAMTLMTFLSSYKLMKKLAIKVF